MACFTWVLNLTDTTKASDGTTTAAQVPTNGTEASSVLIADDHIMLAEAIAAALSAPPRQFTTEIATTLDQTKAALKSGRSFDLVMLDIRMPGMLGLKSIDEVIAAAGNTRVVLLSGNADKVMVQSAVENGARGLIPKTMSIKSVVSVVDFILSGQVFLPAEDYQEVGSASRDGTPVLSKRETGVLQLTSEGLTNKEIASAFGSTEVSVKMHMRAICRKLDARNRAHAVTLGKQLGILL
jgi:two-component system nitrate/nitrite response regulator NarL